jgi:UDP:flavonoid glycosyltransferase YjiC (YdhE family)
VIYSEFNLSAIVAAKMEGVKIATGYSFPVQKSYASNSEYSHGVQKYLSEMNLPSVDSVLDLFNWADLKIVPSSYDLEPIPDVNVVFTGPFFNIPHTSTGNVKRNKIVSYINASLSAKKVIEELTKAFGESDYDVFISTEEVDPFTRNNIFVGKRFDFSKLMPEAVAYLNHGGQNSVMTGLIHGVPQIICPGIVFERKYNADSVVNLDAGIRLSQDEFTADRIKTILEEFQSDHRWYDNAKKTGEDLLGLGGLKKAVKALEKLAERQLSADNIHALPTVL